MVTVRVRARSDSAGRATIAQTVLASALLVAGVGVAGVPAASAHDRLLDSVPAPDAVLAEPPSVLELQFSADLVSAAVVTTDGCGLPVPSVSTTTGRAVTAELELSGVPDVRGRWTVSWVTIGGDGHEVEGSLGFTVAGGPECTAPVGTVEVSEPGPSTAVPVVDDAASSGGGTRSGAENPIATTTSRPTVPSLPVLAAGVVLLAGAGAVLGSRVGGRGSGPVGV